MALSEKTAERCKRPNTSTMWEVQWSIARNNGQLYSSLSGNFELHEKLWERPCVVHHEAHMESVQWRDRTP